MIDHFNELPEHSRIWIYQADRQMSESEIGNMLEDAQQFAAGWAAHGRDLVAAAKILHRQFLILSVNEKANGASGCSIDASVHFLRSLENKYGIQLLDRTRVALMDDEEKIKTIPLNQIRAEIDKGTIKADTLIFNNLVNEKSHLKDKWIIPAHTSWMKKYFNHNGMETK